MSLFLHFTILVSLMLTIVKAQVGPSIISPANNASVSLGKSLEVQYSYPNLGPGTYTVDASLWQDASATQLIQNLLTGTSVPEGVSNGTNNAFNSTTTISLQIPSNLNDTFYLTLLQHVKTQSGNTYDVRSAPMMLHSGAISHLPQPMIVLLSITLVILGFLAM
ncbi:uncharacterized protein BX664DRAFT_337684 [Halteromyces radiatus]|uniref:uncharacterized protein n=1 Tax=Halteromyces radiatus TaxID=101107 RepID=UPI00221F4327|nr:uncharacterized protein BX664DRAFT_337684 [Halteromyces radiatus]KAI8084747.1 hypothetical protein BX664DRAFT_337684 [Halteromyces radiatus]